MKKMPMMLLVPMIALVAVVSIATAVRLLPRPQQQAPVATQYPNPFGNDETTQPATFLGKLLNPASTPSPTPASSNDLSSELKTTVDDGGESDFDALEQEASAL